MRGPLAIGTSCAVLILCAGAFADVWVPLDDFSMTEYSGVARPADPYGDPRGTLGMQPAITEGEEPVFSLDLKPEEGKDGGWLLIHRRITAEELEFATALRVRARCSRPNPEGAMTLVARYTAWAGKSEHIDERPFGRTSEWEEVVFPLGDEGTPLDKVQMLRVIVAPQPLVLSLREVQVRIPDAQLAARLESEGQRAAQMVEQNRAILAGKGIALPEGLAAELTGGGLGDYDGFRNAHRQARAAIWQAYRLNALRARADALQMKARAAGLSADPIRDAMQDAREARRCVASGAVREARETLDGIERALNRVGEPVDKAFAATGKIVTAAKTSFLLPDGTPFNPLGAALFRNIYAPSSGNPYAYSGGEFTYSEADIAYLAGNGFNAVRLVIQQSLLEPEEGRFDDEYVRQCETLIRWCERYGIVVSIDFHWPLAPWFREGPEGFRNPDPGTLGQNFYQNPEAVLRAWRRIARMIAPYWNILGCEVPGNEPVYWSWETGKGITTVPWLMHAWNQWLKETYGSREALNAAWRDTGGSREIAEFSGLRDEETWDADSILPPGFQGLDGQDERLYSRRVWDYLQWSAQYHANLGAQEMALVQQQRPGTTFHQQYIVGDVWDRSPLQLNYQAVSQWVPGGATLGTHYGVGFGQATKVRSLGAPSYDSECNLLGVSPYVVMHHAKHQGLLLWCYFGQGKSGDFIANTWGDVTDQAAYLPLCADLFTRAVAKPEPVRVCIIESPRLAALGGDPAVTQVGKILRALDVDYDVIEGHVPGRDAGIIEKYDALIINLDFAHPDAVRVVLNSDRHVFAFGRIGPNVAAQYPGVEREFAFAGIERLLRKRPEALALGEMRTLDLTGYWKFTLHATAEEIDVAEYEPGHDDSEWGRMRVPGNWGEEGMIASGQFRLGQGIYRRAVTVPAEWAGQDLTLEFGAIDEYDWAYFNGRLIGHTGSETPEYWAAPRRYRVPADAVRFGEPNVIALRVHNGFMDGGVTQGPARLTCGDGGVAVFEEAFGGVGPGDKLPALLGPNSPRLSADVREDTVRVVARANGGDGAPVLIARDRLYYWAADTVSGASEADTRLIAGFLEQAAIPATYPSESAFGKVQVFRAAEGVTLANFNGETREITLHEGEWVPLIGHGELSRRDGRTIVTIGPRQGEFLAEAAWLKVFQERYFGE